MEKAADERSLIEKKIDALAIRGRYNIEKANLKRMLMFSLAANGVLSLLLVLFTIAYASVLNGRDVSVIIPPGTMDDLSLSFGDTRASRSVMEIYSDYLARAFGNVNYENADKVYDNLLNYIDGDIKYRTLLVFKEKARQIKQNLVTQTFQLSRVELDRDHIGTLARCYGHVTRKIGGRTVYTDIPYVFTFWFKTYRGNVAIVGMSSDINMNPEKSADKARVDAYVKDNKYINF